MAKRVQRVRHDAAAAQAFLGKDGEITVDRSNSSIRVHDGINAGGVESSRADLNNVVTASASSHGKMSAAQASNLVQALLDIITNAASIVTEEARATAAEATKADLTVPVTAGNVALLTVDGNLQDSGKSFASTDDVIDNFEDGTLQTFPQASAPVGWTKETTHDNKSFRIVSGAGGGSGGTKSFTTTFGSGKTADAHALTASENGPHTHEISVYGALTAGNARAMGASPAQTGTFNSGSSGSGSGHTHPLTNFDLQYVDSIIASKN